MNISIGKILLSLCLLWLSSSCSGPSAEDFTNKSSYELKVGDTLRIYYTTNSCCYECAPNKDSLNNLIFIGSETVISGPKGVEGGNSTRAILFKATNIGTDTIYAKIIGGGMECSDTIPGMTRYIVNIKK
ncbi:MAG: hypothetical protein ACJASQ_000236 [Crocinitomicaceae bacterium]|jgi:hypothetical protein